MTTPSLPDWLTVGAPVAIETFGTGAARVTLGTVERINKASVTVNGERYPLPTLTRRWGGTWGHQAKLHDPRDPHIVARRSMQTRNARLRKAESATVDALRDFDANAQALRDAIKALAPHLGLTVTDTPAEAAAPEPVAPAAHDYTVDADGRVHCTCGETSARIALVSIRKQWIAAHCREVKAQGR